MQRSSFFLSIQQSLKTHSREPSILWGLRVAFSVLIPLLWGLLTDQKENAIWMAIAAESVSLIDLKGHIEQRIRILVSASCLVVLFCVFGSFAGKYAHWSIFGMFVVGFLSALFKNLGERGMGLALGVYIFYIITSGNPVADVGELSERIQFVALGAFIGLTIGLFSFLFLRVGTPYRQTIAKIWNAVADLAQESGKGWNGQDKKSFLHDIYLKEKKIRAAIDSSLGVFEGAAARGQRENHRNLIQVRKSASLAGLYLVQLTEAAGELSKIRVDRRLSLQIGSLFRVLQQIGERMEVFMGNLKAEEKAILRSRLQRLERVCVLLLEQSYQEQPEEAHLLEKMVLLSRRIAKMASHSLTLLEKEPHRRVLHAYSFAQTFGILHPKHLRTSIRILFDFNYQTTRYAFRIGISAMVAAMIAHAFFPDHGYWIPFTTIVVAQPYVGATIKKGLQRSAGTIAGILVGFAFLSLPFPDVFRLVLVFFSAILMIFFLRRNYSVSAFFVTLFMVGLLGVELEHDGHLLTMRVTATLIGSALAIFAGFFLFPIRDKKMLPEFFVQSFLINFDYFKNTFYYNLSSPWIRLKRSAETMNANTFDSMTRIKDDPIARRRLNHDKLFLLITHNVRLTRELNNFNSETEVEENRLEIADKEKYIQLLYECDDLFRENARLLQQNSGIKIGDHYLKTFPESGFKTLTPTVAQLVFVEKLLMELKFMRTSLDEADLFF